MCNTCGSRSFDREWRIRSLADLRDNRVSLQRSRRAQLIGRPDMISKGRDFSDEITSSNKEIKLRGIRPKPICLASFCVAAASAKIAP
jgi:hypothetical protein